MAKWVFPSNIPWNKRLLDLILSGIGLVVLSPLLLVIGGLILILEGRPILFHQQRPGFHGKIFTLYKFRTMRQAFAADGTLLPDNQRVSSLGKLLRATSLDELPELLNVFRGEMSLVGPRPLLVQYLERYTPEQARRHDALPGITGWAQINGRNALSWEDKFQLDVWYVDHQSMALDLKIIFLTAWKVLKREGINEPGQTTATEFMGSQHKADDATD